MERDCPDQFETQSLRARTSDLDDIDLLVRDCRPGVFRYVPVRVVDRDFAETVTQDCFMRAYRSRGDFRGECSVRTWLITIATNVIPDYTRTKRFRFWKEANAIGVELSEIHDRVAARKQVY
jgi:RNA polymerase sigma-70 factor (ECF subfamily)